MRSVNEVTLIGNLTRDPELRQTQNSQEICTFGLATNRQWVTTTGQKASSTEFHEIVVWSKLASICAQYLRKGKLVYINGYLKTRSWEQDDGTRRFRTEIVATDMIMLDKRSAEDESPAPVAKSTPAPETPVVEESAPDTEATDTEAVPTDDTKSSVDQAEENMPF